ncbi:MAG: phosphoribosyltransferase family protein [Eubacteriales bacterium]|nr:phosphoribosyltransferase family protein [Eubacteriales bacterium]MDD4323841.1 phosphoribosyltransferase family protein [Eubacteriales bacterium]MDD4541663.1 phosphoribosyltransferase family protein [Eubacteriales bacterium]
MTRIPTADEYEKQIRYSKNEIEERLCALGKQIDRDFPDGLILLVYLRGAAVFGCDLLRKITVPADIDFLSIGRYQVDEDESPLLYLRQDTTVNIYNRNVLLCTDIVRSGFTMHFLLQQLRARNPKSLQICTLLHNPDQQLLPLPLAYIGFDTTYASLCGYGMHFRDQGRQFPDIVELVKEK